MGRCWLLLSLGSVEPEILPNPGAVVLVRGRRADRYRERTLARNVDLVFAEEEMHAVKQDRRGLHMEIASQRVEVSYLLRATVGTTIAVLSDAEVKLIQETRKGSNAAKTELYAARL